MASHSLSDALHQLMHAYKRQLREGIQRHRASLPITHIRVLKGICRDPRSTPRSIAQRMNQDKAQITRVLNELTQAGFIERTRNPKDGRSQLLAATRKGKQKMSKIELLEKQVAARMTRNLSTEELEAFIRIAGIMIEDSFDADTTDKGLKIDG